MHGQGLGPRRTRYAGTASDLFPTRKRYKKGGTSAPPAVDPTALAGLQLNANLATAQKQSELSNVRTTSPLGTSFFEQDPSGRWNLNQALTPQLQSTFGNQVDLSGKLAGLGGNIANIAALPALAGAN